MCADSHGYLKAQSLAGFEQRIPTEREIKSTHFWPLVMTQTCLLLPWHPPRALSTPSCPAPAITVNSSCSSRDNARLVDAMAAHVQIRHSSVAVGRCTYSRVRCSVSVAPSSQPLTTTMDKAWQAKCAAVLAIGTANPTQCVSQDEFVDWYFRVTKSDHLTRLKAKMKKLCMNSGIKRRYLHHTEETFRDHPEFIDHALPSLHSRQDILASAVPELAATAARRAIAEWGRPAHDVTHLIFATSSGAHMPGADLRLASLLGLRPSVQRTMLYFNGCASGSAALRLAKDVAENNPGARVLVACADLSLIMFRPPHEDHPHTLIMQALFGDGAGAVIVGAGKSSGGHSSGCVEHPLFEMVSAAQTAIPGSQNDAAGKLSEDGLVFRPSQKMPALVRQHVEQSLVQAVGTLGFSGGWNDLFWAVHPGGPAILDSVETALALAPRKLVASRHVLAEYGNMSGVSVMFVLDELRRRKDEPPGALGVMLGLGPGVTVETMLLRACSGLKE